MQSLNGEASGLVPEGLHELASLVDAFGNRVSDAVCSITMTSREMKRVLVDWVRDESGEISLEIYLKHLKMSREKTIAVFNANHIGKWDFLTFEHRAGCPFNLDSAIVDVDCPPLGLE